MNIQDTLEVVKEAETIAKNIANEPENSLLILSLFLGFIVSIAIRVKKLQKQDGFNYSDFFTKDAPSLIITICFCTICFISRQSVIELKVGSILIGKWMYLVFFALAMVADITTDKFTSGYEQYLDKINREKTQ